MKELNVIDNSALRIDDSFMQIQPANKRFLKTPFLHKPALSVFKKNEFFRNIRLSGYNNTKMYVGPTSAPTLAYVIFFVLLLSVLCGELISLYLTLPEEEATKLLEPSFLFAALLIGFGLSLDVKFMTLAISHRLDRLDKKLAWICNVTLLHTLFPLLGILISLFLANWGTFWMRFTGIVGLACCTWYLFQVCSEYKNPSIRNPEVFTNTSNLPSLRQWAIVIGVSLDAFLAGPALASEMQLWSNGQILASIPIFGLVVAGSLITTLMFMQVFFSCPDKKAIRRTCQKIKFWRLFTDVSLVSYFASSLLFKFILNLSLSRLYFIILAITFASLLSIYLNKTKDLSTKAY